MQITKSVSGEKKGKDDKRGSDTMGMKHVVRFGLYEINGSINVQLAEKTGFSQEDADIVKECLHTLFVNDASSARPDGSMEVVKLFWWNHNCKDGQYSSAKVHRSVKVALKDADRTPISPEDYVISLEPLPGSVWLFALREGGFSPEPAEQAAETFCSAGSSIALQMIRPAAVQSPAP